MFDGRVVLMPDKDVYDRLVAMWAGMSVYGSLVGVAAFTFGLPDSEANSRGLLYNISCSLLLSASMLLMIPVCQVNLSFSFFHEFSHFMRSSLLYIKHTHRPNMYP